MEKDPFETTSTVNERVRKMPKKIRKIAAIILEARQREKELGIGHVDGISGLAVSSPHSEGIPPASGSK